MNVSVTDTNDPNYVTDFQIVQNAADLIQQYLATLVFSQDTNGLFNGSPYDVFLIKNGVPRQPNPAETPVQYSRRLLQLITNLSNPVFVTDPADGHFQTQTHGQSFQFGTNELAGLKIFFARPNNAARGQSEVGNCVACHTPPAFTDFLFHNTGATQEEYDSIHGSGAFQTLFVPGLAARQSNYNAYLPPTPNNPCALGTFATPPNTNDAGQADLGLWNVFANPDFPAPQDGLHQILPLLIPTAPPQIQTAAMTNGQFVFTGSNGPAGWMYYIISSADLTVPMSEWDVLATNFFDASGGFGFTNSPAAGQERAFYALSVPPPSDEIALPAMAGLFKTPGVRDLGSSEPYLHTGRMNSIENVIGFYENFSTLAKAGMVRNAAPELNGISLDDSAVVPLAAFLRSLNEDYVDIPCPCMPQ